MAFLVAVRILMAGISSVLLCYPEGTLGRDTAVFTDQHNWTQVDSVTSAPDNTDLAFRLHKTLVLKNPGDNVLFSPFSVSASLSVLSLGAKNNTLKQILENIKFIPTETSEADIDQGFGHLLHMLSRPGDQVQISIGSAMFIEKHLQILAEFKEKARALYQAEAFKADFRQPQKAKKLINDYVRKQTQGKIKELISDLDKRTSMVLVDYIYFKDKWKMPFDSHNTLKSTFHLDKKRSVKVPMIKIEGQTTPYFRDEELSCSVVELKYTGNASALFILPDQGKMQQVEASLKLETLRKWKEYLRPRRIDELYLPKFSISRNYRLENILPELGIKEVFSPQADLSGITGIKGLRVSQMVHKAVLDMTEPGTETATAAGVKTVLMSAKLDPITVNFNSPFTMIITDEESNNIIYMAKVTNPNQG
ncbi:serine protease inhibitor A3N-like [Acomys russatus]|uniref:serine protease inhibitor A3N-like n=1 Tax=Acomys russatus TaxID=60746 RepID=UPI0021E1FA45|nr:serine protease inhibitor A3N-like [Acomys russatus]